MGAGNVCVNGDFEGLFYLDLDYFPYEFVDDEGNIFVSYETQNEIIREDLLYFASKMQEKCKSFKLIDEYVHGLGLVLLENGLFYITIEDNGWSVAVKLLQKDQPHYEKGNYENLQSAHYRNYLDKMRDSLFELYPEIGVYGGPWTSGIIKREDYM